MISADEITAAIQAHCLVTRGDLKVLRKGHLRVGTKMLYPDGSGIDLFVERGDLIRQEGYAISDFGRTFTKLAEFQMNVKAPKSRLQTIADMARVFGVELMGERLVVELDKPEELGDGLIRLGQGCVSVASLVYTRRSSRQFTLSEEVHAVIEESALDYESKFQHNGPYNKPVIDDYRVTGQSKKSSILAIGPHHSQAADAFNKWSDLRYVNVPDNFVTIFDDRAGYDRSEDLARLERISEVYSIKNRNMIESVLKAA